MLVSTGRGLVAKKTDDTTDEETAVRRFCRAARHRHRRASGRLGADRGTSVGRTCGGRSPGLCRLGLASGSTPADWVKPTTPADVPYALPVRLPSTTSSPAVAADAPYTPAVLNLIAQLEPSNPPTEAQLANASILFHGGTNATCNNVGPDGGPDRHHAEHHGALLDRRPGGEHLLRARTRRRPPARRR